MQSAQKISRKQNPREKTHPLCAVLFLHMLPIFWKFNKKEISKEDLYEALNEHRSKKLGDELETIWNEENPRYKKIALHIALCRQFKWELFIVTLIHACAHIIAVAFIPTSVGGLVLHFEKGPINGNIADAYYYAALLFFAICFRNFVFHPGTLMLSHICMKMRIACCALIYRKALKLSPSALSQTTIGQIVNLLSNDVGKFDQVFIFCIYIFVSPLATAIATYQLYSLTGGFAFSGTALLISAVPLHIFLGKLTSKIRLTTSVRTDERLRLMNEILSGINVIKMYTWEVPFAKLVTIARRYEIKAIRSRFYVEAIRGALEMSLPRAATFITLVLFVSLGNNISATTVFVINATYGILRPLIGSLFPLAIGSLADVYISVKRLQHFLRFEEVENVRDYNRKSHKKGLNNHKVEIEKLQMLEAPKIFLNNISVKWCKELNNYALENIYLNINCNQLVALIGPVGSGKSTLFNVILKELPVTKGTLNTHGKISFAAQEPWLFSESVKQNIIFSERFEEERYNKVINVCALKSDLDIFPYGDQTIISENGKSLSGGQRARINLARCVYRQADIYLLDDPLSAVDTTVGKYLYKQCIKHFLKDKICVLVTHQLQYVTDVDKILVLENGKLVGQGTYNELQNTRLNVSELLKKFGQCDEQEQVADETTNLKTDFYKLDKENTAKYQINKTTEICGSGSIAFETYTHYLRAGGGYFLLFCLSLTLIAGHFGIYFGDYFLVYWVTLEQDAIKVNDTITDTYANSFMTRGTIIYIYSGIIILTLIISLVQSIFYFRFLSRASENLHNTIFEKITRATMPFFDINPTGNILNRFSKDVGIVDDYIPKVFFDVVQITLILTIVLILSAIVNSWLVLLFTILLVPYYFIRLFYINTGKGAKRIEGITRSPIFNHITASITGLSTIRTFEAEDRLLEEFDAHQDQHSSAWYLFISATRAFGFWLDNITGIFIIVVVLYFLAASHDYSSGEIGFLLTNYVSLNSMLCFGMRQMCELENYMVSVERVLEYTKVETEPIRNTSQSLPINWPEYGKIIFKNISLKYTSEGSTALKNLNLTILPCEKIGVVGRTGAGKSSLIAALFQIYNTEGTILIDDIDVTKMPIKNLRSKISIIPQQPVLFSGTLRKNLDPLEQYNDNLLWNALEQVELKQVVENCTGGLSTNVQECGSNFSIGQKQLICFARAITCRNQILIMDEATANVDPHTDAVIQKTIRQVFSNCTVITIAHRLHTIMDSDKVLVMDDGFAVEFDHPYNLLQDTNSLFYKMTQSTGKDIFNGLFEIAETSFQKKQ